MLVLTIKRTLGMPRSYPGVSQEILPALCSGSDSLITLDYHAMPGIKLRFSSCQVHYFIELCLWIENIFN